MSEKTDYYRLTIEGENGSDFIKLAQVLGELVSSSSIVMFSNPVIIATIFFFIGINCLN